MITNIGFGVGVLLLLGSVLFLHRSAEGQGGASIFGTKVEWPPAPLVMGTGHGVITATAPLQEYEVKIQRLQLIGPVQYRSIVVTDLIAKGQGVNAIAGWEFFTKNPINGQNIPIIDSREFIDERMHLTTGIALPQNEKLWVRFNPAVVPPGTSVTYPQTLAYFVSAYHDLPRN